MAEEADQLRQENLDLWKKVQSLQLEKDEMQGQMQAIIERAVEERTQKMQEKYDRQN